MREANNAVPGLVAHESGQREGEFLPVPDLGLPLV